MSDLSANKMKKYLTLYNKKVRSEYTVKGLAKLKKEDIESEFNKRFKKVTKDGMTFYAPKTFKGLDLNIDEKDLKDVVTKKVKLVRKVVKKGDEKVANVAGSVKKPEKKSSQLWSDDGKEINDKGTFKPVSLMEQSGDSDRFMTSKLTRSRYESLNNLPNKLSISEVTKLFENASPTVKQNVNRLIKDVENSKSYTKLFPFIGFYRRNNALVSYFMARNSDKDKSFTIDNSSKRYKIPSDKSDKVEKKKPEKKEEPKKKVPFKVKEKKPVQLQVIWKDGKVDNIGFDSEAEGVKRFKQIRADRKTKRDYGMMTVKNKGKIVEYSA